MLRSGQNRRNAGASRGSAHNRDRRVSTRRQGRAVMRARAVRFLAIVAAAGVALVAALPSPPTSPGPATPTPSGRSTSPPRARARRWSSTATGGSASLHPGRRAVAAAGERARRRSTLCRDAGRLRGRRASTAQTASTPRALLRAGGQWLDARPHRLRRLDAVHAGRAPDRAARRTHASAKLRQIARAEANRARGRQGGRARPLRHAGAVRRQSRRRARRFARLFRQGADKADGRRSGAHGRAAPVARGAPAGPFSRGRARSPRPRARPGFRARRHQRRGGRGGESASRSRRREKTFPRSPPTPPRRRSPPSRRRASSGSRSMRACRRSSRRSPRRASSGSGRSSRRRSSSSTTRPAKSAPASARPTT